MNDRILPEAWSDNGWTILTGENEESLLSEGSYGNIYKVEKTNGGIRNEGALKVIRFPENDTIMKDMILMVGAKEELPIYLKESVKQFADEIEIMYKLRSSGHIVFLLDHDIQESEDHMSWQISMLMEYLTSLREYQITKELTEADVLRLGMDICEALITCEKHNIIHRDVKPDNIYVTDDGRFKLGGFDVARAAENTQLHMSAKGTAQYMAPEVIRIGHYDYRVDQYSLGIMLYRLMNRNRMPFIDPTVRLVQPKQLSEAMERRLKGETLPPPIDASEAFAKVILKACAFDPRARYADAKEFYDALRAVAEGK